MEAKTLWTLFATFFKIGLFTFGGGYAMIPIIEDICVERNRWITHEDMMQVTIIAESTPGPIAINCATFVGHRVGGIAGSVASTFGVVLPSFIIIYSISMFLESFLEITVIASAFRGIKIAVGILIINAGFKMMKKIPKTLLSRVILVSALAAMLMTDLLGLGLSTITMMVLAAAVSIGAKALEQKGGEAK